MSIRPGSVLLALSALSALAGESGPDIALPASSAKDAITPLWQDGMDPSVTPGEDGLSAKAAKGVLLPPRANRRWILGGGFMWRRVGDIEFATGITRLTPPNVFGSDAFTAPPGIGPVTGYVDRSYDDGFVSPGPRVGATGRTTAYGYDNQSQLQGDTLVYMASGGERRIVTPLSSASSTAWRDDPDWELSPYLKLGRLTDLGNGWSVGPAFHFLVTTVEGGRDRLNTRNASERLDVYDVKATDTYDSSGLLLFDAPYIGSPGAVAPLLPAEPSGRVFDDTLRSTDLAVFHDSISESLDIDLFGVSLGGEAVYQTNERFSAGVGAGVVLNLVDWDAARNERLIRVIDGNAPVAVGFASGRNSGIDLLWGAYLQGALGYQVNESFSVEATARYDWNQRLEKSMHDSDIRVDLSGVSVGIGCRCAF